MCSLPPWFLVCFFFSSRRRHTRYWRDWSSDVCSSDLLGDLAEDPGAHRIELDGDLPVAGRVGIRLDLGAVELGARQQRALLHDVRNLALRLGLLVDTALIEELRTLGQASGRRVLHRGALVEQLELQQRGLDDQRLAPLPILQAGQLDENTVLALTGDGRLGHA